MRTLADLWQQLPATSDAGLSAEAVTRSRELFGSNRLSALPREAVWKKFLDKFDEPIIKILLAAALLSMFVELFHTAPLAAGGALASVCGAVVALVIGGWQRWVPALLFAAAGVLFLLGLSLGHTL